MGPLVTLLVQRIALGLLLLFLVSILIFAGTSILPGDVAQSILGQSATPEALANLRAELGLNDPPLTRYFAWLGGVLTGDLGTALTSGLDISSEIGRRLGNTLFLAFWAALVAVPLYHKNAMAGAIKPMLHCGGSVVMLPDFEPRRFLATLAEYRCTKASAVPTVFTKLLQQHDLIESLDFSNLRSLKVGSATVQPELTEQIRTTFGVSVSESYGLTEGGPVMIGPPLDGRPVPHGSCGVAWPEGEVKLVAADGTEHPSDGELHVRNPGVTPGYHNLPEVNAKRIRDGWLATGDLFHCDADGFYYFRGRTDDMFKSGGENVYPKEVENILIAHPKVYDACVSPVADPLKGDVPVALVMLEPGESAAEDELRRWTLERGPAYAHPRRIAFVDTMPLNGAGKVDRLVIGRMLADMFAAEIAARREATA